MKIYNENPYKKILPIVIIVLLSVIVAALINNIQSKREEALLSKYNTFEKKFRQVSSGDTEINVKRLLGPNTSAYKEDKLIPRGPIKKWEYKIFNRVYIISFMQDKISKEKNKWRVYAKFIDNPADAKRQKVDGYMNIIKLSFLFSCIYFGYMSARKIYWKIMLKKNSNER
jgi:hypothetical protein